jgi:ubiquinone biosynthesis protein UbiJ
MSARNVAAMGIQQAVNRLLALDPEFAEGVAEFEGTVLEIHVQGLDERLQLHASASGIGVIPVSDDQQTGVVADVVISGPPFTLLRLAASLDSVDGVLPPDVSISGELQLVQRLTLLAKRARFDWEEPLSNVLGDSLAHELGRGMRAFATQLGAAAGTLVGDVGEYLREERRVCPTRLEVDDFSAGVDTTRDDVERLEVRIARLAGRTGGFES